MAFLPKLVVETAVASLTERLNSRLAREAANLMGENHGIPLGISIGVAFAPFHAKEYNSLFHYADTALYRAKQNGKHGYAIYETQDFVASDEENLEHELIRVSQILGERGDRKGAMILGKEAFSWNYRFIIRFIDRYSAVATKMLLSLSFGARGVPTPECIEEFTNILQKNLRSSDIIFQNRPNQFFIVLPLLSKEDSPKVVDRVLTAWANTQYSDMLKINSAMSLIEVEKESI
jgi:GGDEF domain-containing protein